jgi:hypothetical protein
MLHLDQRGPLRLGLDNPSRLAINKQQVVDPAMLLLKRELPDRNPGPGRDIGLIGVLDDPAGVRKLPVDLDPRLCLAREVGVVSVGHGP